MSRRETLSESSRLTIAQSGISAGGAATVNTASAAGSSGTSHSARRSAAEHRGAVSEVLRQCGGRGEADEADLVAAETRISPERHQTLDESSRRMASSTRSRPAGPARVAAVGPIYTSCQLCPGCEARDQNEVLSVVSQKLSTVTTSSAQRAERAEEDKAAKAAGQFRRFAL